MESDQFWLVLVSGIVIGMLLSMGARWLGRKLLGKSRANQEAFPESNPTQTTDQTAPNLKGRRSSDSK